MYVAATNSQKGIRTLIPSSHCTSAPPSQDYLHLTFSLVNEHQSLFAPHSLSGFVCFMLSLHASSPCPYYLVLIVFVIKLFLHLQLPLPP